MPLAFVSEREASMWSSNIKDGQLVRVAWVLEHLLFFFLFLGLTLTADVRHSHVMGRQYLNVLFTPTVAFKGHTEGLCGVMDNDPSNDMRGSDGEQYNDPIKFAESCKYIGILGSYVFGFGLCSAV